MQTILGISAYYHDAAAALISGGQVVAAAQEERFTRVKHTAEFPLQAIRYCLDEAGLTVDDLDAVVFYDKPLLKFERLLETYYAYAPRGLVSFLQAMPVWLKDKLFLKKRIRDGLRELGPFDAKRLRLLFPEHHLSHAASAFYASPFDSAAVLTIDGVGEWATASIAHGRGRSLAIRKELHFPHSLGLLYSAFTGYLGFKVNSGEYKMMGLAPYGNAADPQVATFEQAIKEHLIHLYPDGSLWLNPSYFRYATGLRMYAAAKWQGLFGFPPRAPESALEQHHSNLALAIQRVTEEAVIRMAAEARRLTGESRICLAGGVALNCVANARLRDAGLFREVYVQPAAGDAGGALGAALAAQYLYFGAERPQPDGRDIMNGAYLGPAFTGPDIERMARRRKAVFRKAEGEEELLMAVASDLAAGKVVGWFQGRMEFGPRALGNRSILADAGRADMQLRLNRSVKHRENFRPFAPAVPEEVANRYFELPGPSPYMLFTAPVKSEIRHNFPSGFDQWPLHEKLAFSKSALPAVTHLDYSARVQTVSVSDNPLFHQLLHTFGRLSGYPVLVNTSFNVRGEPVVCTPQDAWRCFMATDMDCLVMDHYIFYKTEQTGATPDRAIPRDAD